MITVDELVAAPRLGLGFLAGAAGGGRPITWAHTCDLPEPWLWVGPGDLMMTTGGGLPADPEAQADWLARLAATHACGLLIGPGPGTPEISEAMRRRADDLRFPLIDGRFELEFAGVAHLVIESALRSERDRIIAVRRLYDAWAQALHARTGLPERLRMCAAVLGWGLVVRDLESGTVEADATGSDIGDRTATRAHGAGPDEIERGEPTSDARVTVPIPGTCPAELVATPGRRPVDDTLLPHHLAALVAVDLEHHAEDRSRRRDSGAELFEQLLSGELPLVAARTELRHRGLTGALVLACFHPAEPERASRLHHAGPLRGLCPPLLTVGEHLLALLPDDPSLVRRLRSRLGERTTVGLSAPLAAVPDVPEAARQARLACGHADPGRDAAVSYPRLPGLLPRSVTEARELVARHLTPLVEHDAAHGTQLVRTVREFLARDGAWQASAAALGIHRQTLVHRLRTVRELTGLPVTSTEGTATMWLTLQAADHVNLPNYSHTDD
jgi:purine catabolism regulator